MQIEGVVESTYSKMVNTRNGQAPVYHVVVDGSDVNCGFKDPGYEEQEFVTLDVENTNYGLKLKAQGRRGRPNNPTPRASAPVSRGTTPASTTARPGFPVAKNTKDISIIRQNSGNHASRMVAALIAKGAIKTEDEALETFMNMAYAITDFATGHREEAQAKAMLAAEDD